MEPIDDLSYQLAVATIYDNDSVNIPPRGKAFQPRQHTTTTRRSHNVISIQRRARRAHLQFLVSICDRIEARLPSLEHRKETQDALVNFFNKILDWIEDSFGALSTTVEGAELDTDIFDEIFAHIPSNHWVIELPDPEDDDYCTRIHGPEVRDIFIQLQLAAVINVLDRLQHQLKKCLFPSLDDRVIAARRYLHDATATLEDMLTVVAEPLVGIIITGGHRRLDNVLRYVCEYRDELVSWRAIQETLVLDVREQCARLHGLAAEALVESLLSGAPGFREMLDQFQEGVWLFGPAGCVTDWLDLPFASVVLDPEGREEAMREEERRERER